MRFKQSRRIHNSSSRKRKPIQHHKKKSASVLKEKRKELIHQVMHDFKHKKLYSSSRKRVTNRKQAIAIALSMSKKLKK